MVDIEYKLDHYRMTESRLRILKFLNRFPELTFLFSDSPGKGHYAATKLIMDRVRWFGYTGKFRIRIHSKIRSEVYPLLPGYDPKGASEQFLPLLNANTEDFDFSSGRNPFPLQGTTIDAIQKTGQVQPIRSLAISGGLDWAISPKSVGVDAILSTQPSGWEDTPSLRLRKKDAVDESFLKLDLKTKSTLN